MLRNFLEKQQRHFKPGGKLASLQPVFEMMDSFLYTTGNRAAGSVHLRDALDLKRMMSVVVLSLLPCFFMALYNTGLQANLALQNLGGGTAAGWRGAVISWLGSGYDPAGLSANIVHGALYFFPVYLVCVIAGGLCEVIFAVLRRHEVNEGFFVTSFLIPLILPPTIPLWQVALATVFGVVIGKEVFGGTGMNVFNPALVTRAFLFFAYPAQFSGTSVWVAVDGFSSATPLSLAALEGYSAAGHTWWQSFLGTIPGSMGETSTLACLIGALILIVSGIASWRIMLTALAAMAATALMFNLIGSSGNPMFAMPPHWHLVLGGFAFGTVFMATDPVSAAQSERGKYYYGALIGFLTVLVRVVNPAYPDGIMLAILFANTFAPLMDYLVLQSHLKKRRRRHAL
jgi:Na+-transporting NADH:ubiquinone oxidoreductase subunit B